MSTTFCQTWEEPEVLALMALSVKWRWRAKRRAAGKPTDNPNMVCGPVQVVWHKFARYWDIEMREVPMSPGRYMMDPASMLEYEPVVTGQATAPASDGSVC
jgi:glutamate decarboxylase